MSNVGRLQNLLEQIAAVIAASAAHALVATSLGWLLATVVGAVVGWFDPCKPAQIGTGPNAHAFAQCSTMGALGGIAVLMIIYAAFGVASYMDYREAHRKPESEAMEWE